MSKSINSAFRLPTAEEALGQVFTPEETADEMIKRLLERRPNTSITLLDPCVGPGTFLKAAAKNSLLIECDKIIAFDIDKNMVDTTLRSCNLSNLTINVKDYLEDLNQTDKADFIIMNPPYVRQEWIKKKLYYRKAFKDNFKLDVPGTSNLYVYFIVKAIHDLKVGGEFAFIIYDSWQSTLFGKWLINFLFHTCTNLSIENLHNQPFKSRLIDATILTGKKKDDGIAEDNSKEPFKFERNSFLTGFSGFDRISTLFETKRGLRLKQADFFLCSSDQKGATQFVKKVNNIKGYIVPNNYEEAALLINGTSKTNKKAMSELHKRLNEALARPNDNIPILKWYIERPKDWFVHSTPPTAPLLINYYLRNRPKHFYNPSLPYSDNFYGLQCLNSISIYAWLAILNSTAVCIELLSHARNQGGGLSKLQLFEYRKSLVPDLRKFSKADVKKFENLGMSLINYPGRQHSIIREIDDLLYQNLNLEILKPEKLDEAYRLVSTSAKKPKDLHK